MKRRDVLRGLGLGAGASVLGPYLSRVVAQAQGGPASKRLIILLEGDSIHPRRSTPVEVLANLNRVRREQSQSEVELSGRFDSRYYVNNTPLITEGITLPRALEPLAAYRDELVMVQGLSHKIGGGGHTGDYSTLSSTQGSRQTPGGITIDKYLGQRHPDRTPFDSLALGVSPMPLGDDGRIDSRVVRKYNTTAYGRNNPAPITVNPSAAYRDLFGVVSNNPREFGLQGDLLDALNEDLRIAGSRLAGPERVSLDAFAGSVETLRDRRAQIVTLEDALRRSAPVFDEDKYTSGHPLARLEAQCDLASAALVAGLTNVALVASGTSDDLFNLTFTSFGDDFPHKHALGHGEGYQGETNNYWLGEIHHRHSALAARMIESLKVMPEGDGTMWDNTLLIYMCDGGEKHHANFSDWVSVLLAGRNIPLNTATGGRSVLYPKLGSDNHRQLSNLWNTVAHALDMPEDDFGGEAAAGLRVAPGPLDEVLG